jgi:hypothetical protein
MAIYVDETVVTHRSTNDGNNTVPPGITGLVWARAVSTVDLAELEAFLTANILTIGQPATNIRTPALGSLITYVGLDATMRTAVVAAGATEDSWPNVRDQAFDVNGHTTYEP